MSQMPRTLDDEMTYGAVSLFSGCGGFCEGARRAGFKTVASVEWDRFAAETYRHNFPETPLFEGDIHAFLDPLSITWRKEQQRFAEMEQKPISMVYGGPPCQGYSQIGTRLLDDPRNELYGQFIRVLTQLRPPVFLMENVPNMLLLNKGIFRTRALAAFAEAGYSNSDVSVVTASDFGVAQHRRRAIFLGFRDDVSFPYAAKDWLEASLTAERRPMTTVRDAIGDLPEFVSENGSAMYYPASFERNGIRDELRLDVDGEFYTAEYKQARAGSRLLHNHHTKEIQERRKKLIALLKPGLKGDSLPTETWDGLRPEKWRRLHPDRPAYTILAQMHRDLSEWVHPDFERWITVREAARLQSFHDGFVFKSSEWQMLKQIGNAVPPLMGRALAAVARRALDQIYDVETLEGEPSIPLAMQLA
jgi:DNA (cytosine-5)-methyltransferase 1